MRQPGWRAPRWEQHWKDGTSHPEMRFGDWRCCNAPTCRYPNHARRDFCRQYGAPEEDAKWELPQDPQTTICACGAIIKSRYTRNCRACHAPILCPDGGAAVYDPQGDKPLPAPSRGGHLQGHSAEPIMLWTEAILNPTGPLEIGGDWPGCSSRLPTCPTSSPMARTPWASRSRTPLRTTWRRHGVWTTAPCVASSWATGGADGATSTPPTLLLLAHRGLAVWAAGSGPHAGLV